MKRLLVIVALLLGISSAGFAVTSTAFAAGSDILDNSCGSVKGGGASAACDSKGTETISGTGGVLYKVTKIVATISGIAAVIVIIAGGLMFITSNGDASKAGTARNTILYAAIGLIVIVLAQSIITLVVNRL